MATTHQTPTFHGTFRDGNPAANYERYFVPTIGGPLAEDLVAAAAPVPGERVLDVGCGTGIVARLAASRVGPSGVVAGADVTEGMLAVARTAASAGDTPVQWYETAAEAMPLPDAAFDIVFCQVALQFFQDKAAAVREMHRVLAPGGRVWASVPAPTAFFEVLKHAVSRHLGPARGAFVQRVFSMHDAAELKGLFTNAGFDAVHVRTEARRLRFPAARDFVWQYLCSTPLMAAVAEATDEQRAALQQEVETGWARWEADGGLASEQPVVTISGRKPEAGT